MTKEDMVAAAWSGLNAALVLGMLHTVWVLNQSVEIPAHPNTAMRLAAARPTCSLPI